MEKTVAHALTGDNNYGLWVVTLDHLGVNILMVPSGGAKKLDEDGWSKDV